jgi:hypothetical protein
VYLPFLSVLTVGCLASGTYSGTMEDYMGCVFSEPQTAQRQGKIPYQYMADWAKEQYTILYNQGLSDDDKIYLPYYIGKYDIDLSEEMLIRFYDNKKNLYMGSLKKILITLKKNRQYLVLPLTNWTERMRIENNTDYNTSLDLLSDNEYLFKVERNTAFLELDGDLKEPHSLLECINNVADKLFLHVIYDIQDKKAYSSISGYRKGYRITVK